LAMMNFARLGLLKLCLGIAYLAVASAAGSTGGTGAAWAATISKDDQYPFYEPDLVQYVASKGSFPVVVVANPFGAGKDGALLAGLELPSYYPPTPFIATTPQNRDDGHIVLVFAPITAANGYDTCRTPASQTITGQKGIRPTKRCAYRQPFATTMRWSARPSWKCQNLKVRTTKGSPWPSINFSIFYCRAKAQI